MTRDVFMDRIPCEALRALAKTEGTAGIGAVSDTTTTGCDELREAEADTQLLAYDRRGDELRIPDATLRLRGDTLVFEDTVRHVEVDGPTRTQTRTWRYVRVPTSAPSPEPQNYPLQPSGATVRVAITVRVLQVQRQSALSRAFKTTACS